MALSPTTSRNLGPLNQLQIQVLAPAHKDTLGNVWEAEPRFNVVRIYLVYSNHD